MEKSITLKSEFDSLEKVLEYLKKESTFDCSIDYDIWDVRTDSNGKMEKCLLIKKSSMHGMKFHFTEKNTVELVHIIPNKLMNAYFGESKKSRQNILEIITGIIKKAVLSSSQNKAFEEMKQPLNKIAA